MFSSMAVCALLAALLTFSLPRILLPFQKKTAKEHFHLDRRPLPSASLALFYGICVCSITSYLAIFADLDHLPSAALFFVIATVGTALARILAGRVYDHRGHAFVVPPAALLLAVAFALIYHSISPSTYYVAAIIYGVGVGSLFPALQTLTLSSVPTTKRTSATAALYVFFDLGSGLGTVIMGILADSFQDYRPIYLVSLASVVVLFSFYAFFFLSSKRRKAFEKAAKQP
jgi:MFS family permease